VAANGRAGSGDHAGGLSVEDTLLRAALLTGYGPEARPLARRLAAVTETGDARSCLDAGAPMQLTIDAPGPVALRVGLRMDERLDENALEGVMAPETRRHVASFLAPLPAASHPSLGKWLFWTQARQSIFVDLRDPSTASALSRLRCVLTGAQQTRLESLQPVLIGARPWALRVEADPSRVTRVHLHWLLARDASPEQVTDAIAPGIWPRVVDTLRLLVRRPGQSGRWVIVTPLEDASGGVLRIANSAWALVPEDDREHRAVAELMLTLNGPSSHAEALWSFCRGVASADWRVGRACELIIDRNGIRARLFFVPQVQRGAAALTSSSDAVIS
jgi:hypothetical protein